MQIWPGTPYPLGATFDGVGTNFSVFSEAGRARRAVPLRRHRRGTRVDLPEMTALCWHGYLPDTRPGQRYGYRVHGPWNPDQGQWCNPSKLLLDPYAKAIEGSWEWNEAIFPYHFADPENSKNDLDSAPFAAKAVVINPFFDWANDRRPNTPWHRTVVYETHVKGFTRTLTDIPEELRGTYAGMAHPAAVKYLQRLGITAVELLPVHQFVQDSHAAGQGAAELLGLQLDRLPRAAQRVRARIRAASRSRSSSSSSRRCTKRASRSSSTSSTTTRPRGQPPRAGAVVQGHRQRGLLPAHGGQPALLHGLHRHGQHAEHASPARAAAHHGQPALLGPRDARRRLPLRPRGDARARAARRRPAVGVLRHHSAGSRRQPGQADRRAVGRRRRRLPGRQLPAALVGVERQVPRHGPRLLARHRSDARRVRVPLHRQLRSLPGHRAAGRTRASTSSPRTTGSRCATSCRTTRSTTRRTARTIATARTTTGRGTAASKGRRTIRRCSRCARGSCGTSWRRCCCRRACRCCSAATRWAAPSAATTTPTARTTRFRGTTGPTSIRRCCSSRSA